MEFGIFIQGYLPGPAAHIPAAERVAGSHEVATVGIHDTASTKAVAPGHPPIWVACGNPATVRTAGEQLQRYEATGVDEVVFGMPVDMTRDEALECIETFGRSVIPEYDRDPVHRTDRMRATASPTFGCFAHEPPAIDTVMTARGA